MAERTPGEQPGRPLTTARLGFLTVVVGALVLGFLGLRTYLARTAGPAPATFDVIYYDLQLFVMGSDPLGRAGHYPWTLQVARFAAPAATVYALFEAARLYFADEVHRFRARHARDHDVVYGDGISARVLAERLGAAGRRVVTVGAAASGGASSARTLRRSGLAPGGADPRTVAELRSAGLGRARALYVCDGDSATNVATALAASSVRRTRGRRLRVHAQIADDELCAALRARRWGRPDSSDLHLDFFNVEELAVHAFMRRDDLGDTVLGEAGAVVVGLGTFGRTVLVEFARQCRLRGVPHQGRRTPVAVIDPAAGPAVAELSGRYPFLDRTCDVTVNHDDLETYLRGRRAEGAPPPCRVYVCHDAEERALREALVTVGLWNTGPGATVVRLGRLATLGAAFDDPGAGTRLLDALGGRLRFVDVQRLACDPAVIDADLVERLGRAVHEHYVRQRAAQGETPGGNPSMAAWEDLTEDLRETNRSQAREIGRKLAEIGCALAPRTGQGAGEVPEFAYRSDELERLARQEHERWTAERRAGGWSHGPVRDNAARRHPDLVDWDALPERSRDKDREAVLALPEILADLGLRIVRPGKVGHGAVGDGA